MRTHGNRSLPFSILPSHLAFEYAFIQNVIIKSFEQFKQSGNIVVADHFQTVLNANFIKFNIFFDEKLFFNKSSPYAVAYPTSGVPMGHIRII